MRAHPGTNLTAYGDAGSVNRDRGSTELRPSQPRDSGPVGSWPTIHGVLAVRRRGPFLEAELQPEPLPNSFLVSPDLDDLPAGLAGNPFVAGRLGVGIASSLQPGGDNQWGGRFARSASFRRKWEERGPASAPALSGPKAGGRDHRASVDLGREDPLRGPHRTAGILDLDGPAAKPGLGPRPAFR